MGSYIADYIEKKLALWPINTPPDILYDVHKKVMDHLEVKIQNYIDTYTDNSRKFDFETKQRLLLPPNPPRLELYELQRLSSCYRNYLHYNKARTDIKLRYLTLVYQLGGVLNNTQFGSDSNIFDITMNYNLFENLNPEPNKQGPPPPYGK
jgi:hypothetical protein